MAIVYSLGLKEGTRFKLIQSCVTSFMDGPLRLITLPSSGMWTSSRMDSLSIYRNFLSSSSHRLTSPTNFRWKTDMSGFKSTNWIGKKSEQDKKNWIQTWIGDSNRIGIYKVGPKNNQIHKMDKNKRINIHISKVFGQIKSYFSLKHLHTYNFVL